ncbi:MAG: transposase [Halobacteriales archaeon]|nr:transposase [Halobacteriales archaeon]
MPATRFSPEQRAEIVLAALEGRRSGAELCREHQITTVTLHRWKEQFLAGGLNAMQGRTPQGEGREQEREMQRMRELVGELALANFAMKKGRTLSTRKQGGRGSSGS